LSDKTVEELRGALLREHKVAHLLVFAGESTEVGRPERVRQKPHVGHDVGVGRQPVLEPEALHRQLETPARALREGLRDLASELVDIDIRGIDNYVALLANGEHPLALDRYAIEKRAVALKRVRTPH